MTPNIHLHIPDFNLISFSGHCFTYTRALRDQARERGMETTIYGNVEMTDAVRSELDAVPLFRYPIDRKFPDPLTVFLPESMQASINLARTYRAHRAALEEITRRIQKSTSAVTPVLFFHTIRESQIHAIGKWWSKLPTDRRPYLILFLRFTATPDPQRRTVTIDVYRRVLKRLIAADVDGKLSFVTDSEKLQEEFEDLGVPKVTVVGIPHTSHSSDDQPVSDRSAGRRIVFAGDARQSKGFHLLPDVVRQIRRDWPEPVTFEFQSHVGSVEDDACQAAMDWCEWNGVTLHKTPLSDPEYDALVSRADILLLPYTTRDYHSQTSGVFCEAAVKGKVQVVSRGTWMASESKKLNSVVLCCPEDAMSVGNATCQALQHYDELWEQARKSSESWCAFHNEQAVFESIIGSTNIGAGGPR